jgi:hypothetical protein
MFFLLKGISLMQIQLKDKNEKCISVTRIFYNSNIFLFPFKFDIYKFHCIWVYNAGVSTALIIPKICPRTSSEPFIQMEEMQIVAAPWFDYIPRTSAQLCPSQNSNGRQFRAARCQWITCC